MLQSILRRTICKNLPTVFSANCSTTSSQTLKKEINQVTLIGTVFGEQFKNDFGQKIIKLKTNDDGSDKYQIHTLYTSTPHDYEAGQRVFVGGALSSRDVMTSENKRRQQPIIRAYQIYALNSMTEDPKKLKDLNSVELLTTVCTDVLNKDDHTIFQVVTHYQNRKTQEILSNFHTVFVNDQNLCKLICNNLEKGDRVFIRGFLMVNHLIDADGKKRQTGSIRAEIVDKVTKFNRNESSEQETEFAE